MSGICSKIVRFDSRFLFGLNVALLSLIIIGCTTITGSPPTLGELINKHTEARGGKLAIEAIRNLEVKVRIVEPTFTVDGVWRVDRRGRMRVDVFAGGLRVFTEAFDGVRAWQLPGEAQHGLLASAAGAAALRHSGQLPTNILGLHEMIEHGHHLHFVGREEVAGVLYYVIELTLDDGFVTRYYMDPASFMIIRARVRKALHPDVDPTVTTIETVWSDFREISGVRVAFQATDIDLPTGKVLETSTLLDVRPNVPTDELLFQMP